MKKLLISTLLGTIINIAGITQSHKIQYSAAVELGKINDSRITEASGIAVSYNTSGAFWVHNDSGDGPNIFLIDSTGKVLSSGSVQNVNSRDWEDIASFVVEGKSYLLIGDVGDNPINKSEYWLYIIEEPVYDAQSTSGNIYPLVRKITYQYENGSQNCESVAVDADEGKIILVSKSGNGSGERFVYEIPLSVEQGNVSATAKLIGQFVMDGTTAMDISNDGQRAIVLTYDDAYEFTRYEGNSWADAFATTPRLINMPARPGGEAIAYGRNGIDLYLVREGSSSPVWFIHGQVENGTVFQVDMFEQNDILNNQVYLNIQGVDTAIKMTDSDEDLVYACMMNLPIDSLYKFHFSYLKDNGAEGIIVPEQLAPSCSNEEGFREIYINKQNSILKPFIFGSCFERPYYVTLSVDIRRVIDLFNGGEVWFDSPTLDTLYSMSDADQDSIYSITVPAPKGALLSYRFGYQNGPNSESDIFYESVPAECSNSEGYREYFFREEYVTLLSVEFASCQEALPHGIDITDLEGTQIMGSNDQHPWEGPTSGSGSPDGQEVDKLIDNNVNSKYLVRAIDSWVDISPGYLTKVHAYTITSGSDVPSRDPHAWEFQGWNMNTNEWETLHVVNSNPSWQERLQRKSWFFENDNWYGKYRLHITEINGDSQELMQMAEMQIFGEVGEEITWSDNAYLKELSVTGFQLVPEFDPLVFDYEINIPEGTPNIVINASPEDQNAIVSGTGSYLLILLTEAPKVTVIAEDGITNNSYTVNYSFDSGASGIKELTNGIKIFPVPGKGTITISNSGNGILNYRIVNLNGMIVSDGILDEGSTIIDLTYLEKGVYQIILSGDSFYNYYKIIRQ